MLGQSPEVTIFLTDRTDLGKQMEQYWFGHLESNIGLPYLTLRGGYVYRNDYIFEREDIITVQTLDSNTFVQPSGRVGKPQFWSSRKKKASEAEIAFCMAAATLAYEQNREWCEAQKAWLDATPWMDVVEMPVAEAAKFLIEFKP